VSAKENWNILELLIASVRVVMMSERMQPGAIQKLLDTDGRENAWLGRPDRNKGSDFF
jgi:hypothetical protein